MSVRTRSHLTAEEYLALERVALEKSEYLDGQMVAMPGGTYRHSLISVNLIQAIGRHLQRPYKVLNSDMRVLVPATGLYTYPDVVVIRGEPTLSDQHRDNLTNPAVIIEVLSPSTESYDRGRKFRHYQTLDSLREYLLISQDRPKVEHFLREDDRERWRPTVVTDLAASITLPSIGCQLELSEIYDGVLFEP
ncbi:MAG TPA: Uma2 family endonuclease [Thermoanaerobaculia bacterium]|nr:Uma2 family endonuclease [Thermoanaerobaculia bacterium]